MKLIQSLILATAIISNGNQTMSGQKTYRYDLEQENVVNNYTFERSRGTNDRYTIYRKLQRIYTTDVTIGVTTRSFKYTRIEYDTETDKQTVGMYYFIRMEGTPSHTVDYYDTTPYSFINLPEDYLSLWTITRNSTSNTLTQDWEDIIDTLTTSNNTTDLENTMIEIDADEMDGTLTDQLYKRYALGSQEENYGKFNYYVGQTILGNNSVWQNSLTGYKAIYIGYTTYNKNQGYIIPSPDINMFDVLPYEITNTYTYFIETSSTTTTEIVDIPGLMFTILGMPFAWLSTAFNLTVFPGTPYAVNISHIFFAIIGALILIYIIKKVLK